MRNLIQNIRQNWLLILIFLMLIGAVILLALNFNNTQAEKILEETGEQLTTLAELKANQITLWKQERIIDAQTVQTDRVFTETVTRLLKDRNDLTLIREIQDRLRSQLLDPNYSSIYLADTEGNIIIQVGTIQTSSDEYVQPYLEEALISHEIYLTDLHRDTEINVHMGLITPLLQPGQEDLPAQAFLIFIITPDTIFYPLIQSLPTSAQTAETLLVRKENNDVLFLNNLRFVEDAALKLKIPLSENRLPAAMAINGLTGVVAGNDYRGEPVMASIKPVDETNWFLIAKYDLDEIYLPIKRLYWLTTLAAIFFFFSSVLAMTLIWRKQSEKIIKGLSDSETKRKSLEAKYYSLFSRANDAIVLVGDSGKIIDVNERAIQLYDYTREEFLSLSVQELRDSSTVVKVPSDMEGVRTGTSNVFQTTHRKKNGELLEVEVSSSYLSIGGEGFFQSIVRDITEQKLAEERLRLSEMALNKAQEISHVGSWNWNLVANTADVSDEMFHIFGVDKNTWDGKISELIEKSIHPDDLEHDFKIFNAAIDTDQTFSLETRIIRPDLSIRDLWIEAGEIIRDDKNKVVAISGIVQDITEKKMAERELRKSENLLQKIYDLLPVGLWITDKTGSLVRSNKMVKEIWGKEILVGLEDFDVFHGRRLPSREEISPDDWASVHTIKEGVTIRDEMIEIDAYDGKTKTILNYSTPILNESGDLEGAIILNLDISELKKAEEQLSAQLDELRRWNLATLGRENRIRDLKNEINELMEKLGQPPKYSSVKDDQHD